MKEISVDQNYNSLIFFPNKKFSFWFKYGEVIEYNHSSESYLYGGGGRIETLSDGSVGGHTNPIQSKILRKTSVWLKSEGEEEEITFPAEISLRKGHKIIVIYVSDGIISLPLRVRNINTGKIYKLVDNDTYIDLFKMKKNKTNYLYFIGAILGLFFGAFANFTSLPNFDYTVACILSFSTLSLIAQIFINGSVENFNHIIEIKFDELIKESKLMINAVNI